MADITISLSNINNTKSVLIEGLGEFKVRKLGAGEELDLSAKMRRMSEILVELQSIDISDIDDKNPTEEDKKRLAEVQKKADVLMNEIDEIKRFELETYKRCFDDGGTGKTEELIAMLPADGRGELFKQIFNPKTVEAVKEEPENV